MKKILILSICNTLFIVLGRLSASYSYNYDASHTTDTLLSPIMSSTGATPKKSSLKDNFHKRSFLNNNNSHSPITESNFSPNPSPSALSLPSAFSISPINSHAHGHSHEYHSIYKCISTTSIYPLELETKEASPLGYCNTTQISQSFNDISMLHSYSPLLTPETKRKSYFNQDRSNSVDELTVDFTSYCRWKKTELGKVICNEKLSELYALSCDFNKKGLYDAIEALIKNGTQQTHINGARSVRIDKGELNKAINDNITNHTSGQLHDPNKYKELRHAMEKLIIDYINKLNNSSNNTQEQQ